MPNDDTCGCLETQHWFFSRARPPTSPRPSGAGTCGGPSPRTPAGTAGAQRRAASRPLLGPVTLKAASVIYRFARYYTGSAPYRARDRPHRYCGALLIASLLVGLVIALLTVHLAGQWRPTGVPVHFRR